jgi:hypothetical protein
VLQLINGDIAESGIDRQQLRKKWNTFDTLGHGFITRREVIQLISSLDIKLDKISFGTALLRSSIGKSTNDEVTFPHLCSLVYELRKRYLYTIAVKYYCLFYIHEYKLMFNYYNRPEMEILWSKVIHGYDFAHDILPLTSTTTQIDSKILLEVISVSHFQHFWLVN